MLPFIRNMKFRTKLFLVCLVISLVPTIILGIFCYIQFRSLLIEREETALRDSIVTESLNISSQINSYETVMDYTIWDSGLNNALCSTYEFNSQMYRVYTDVFEPFLSSIQLLSPGIDEMLIYSNLKIRSKIGTLEPLSTIENCHWYQQILYNNASQKFFYEDDTLFVADTFFNLPSGVIALAYMQINTNKLFSNLTTLFEESFGVLITDADGTPIWNYHTKDLSDSLSKEVLYDQSKQKYIVEQTTDQYTGWIYYIYRPTYIVFQPTGSIITTVLSIVSVCLIFVILFSHWLSHSLVHPLEKLAENMHQVAQENYEITVTSRSSDEVGQLIQNFSNMVQKINHLINETLKAKITQQKLEFRALQAQINPHFLYNTLSLINSQSILSGHPEIGLPAQYMATFYRTSLNNGDDLILVRDELENINAYIDIQLIMHSDSFDVRYDIDEDILSFTMPNLMLQPLVENAILHGIDELEYDRRGCLEISAKASGDHLIFRIADNGCGIPEGKLATILTGESNGYGVANVHTRAQLQYGSEYGLKYQSQVGAGTEVTLTIPIHT